MRLKSDLSECRSHPAELPYAVSVIIPRESLSDRNLSAFELPRLEGPRKITWSVSVD